MLYHFHNLSIKKLGGCEMWYKDSNGNWCLVSVDLIRSSDARHQLFWIKDEDGNWVPSSSLNIITLP